MSTRFKIGLPVAVMALAISSSAFADRGDRGCERDRCGGPVAPAGNYCCPEEACQPVACIEAIPTIKPNCCEGPVLCHAYPTCIECYNVHLDLGFILQQMRITRSDFGYVTTSPAGSLPKQATINRPSFEMNWGITASLGYYLNHDNWFLKVVFDWLRSKGTRTFGDTFNEFVEPINIWKSNLLPGDNCFTIADEVNSLFKVNYFMVQLDLARSSYLGTFSAIEPHFGLRVTWFYFNNKTGFTGAEEIGTNIVERVQKTHFWGIGPEWGVNSKWTLCQGFSFFNDDSLGILFGDTHARDIVKFGPGGGLTTERTNVHQKLQVMSPFAQIVIGIQYDRCMCENTQNLTIKVGMDTTHYWNNWNHIDVINEMEDCGTLNQGVPTFHSIDDAEVSYIGLRFELAWDF